MKKRTAKLAKSYKKMMKDIRECPKIRSALFHPPYRYYFKIDGRDIDITHNIHQP